MPDYMTHSSHKLSTNNYIYIYIYNPFLDWVWRSYHVIAWLIIVFLSCPGSLIDQSTADLNQKKDQPWSWNWSLAIFPSSVI